MRLVRRDVLAQLQPSHVRCHREPPPVRWLMRSNEVDPVARELLRYGAAVAFVLIAASVRWALQPVMGAAPPYITFYLAVAAAAAYGGLGPGLLATAFGALLGAGIATLPVEKLQIGTPAEQVRLVVYLLSGTAISWIAARMHEARRRADAEAARLRELGEQLRVANERLVQSDRTKDQLLALVAHELRNALAPMKTGLQVLRSGKADPETTGRTLAAVNRQVEHMARLVADLLDAARIRHNRMDLQRTRLDLQQLVSRTVDDHRPMFLSRSIGLHMRGSSRHVPVYGDEARLMQVTANLLHNAAKFTPTGGDVHVDVDRRDGFASLKVRDSGIGISETQLTRIFQPFERGDDPHSHSVGGLGLGLALIKAITELHGGHVEARSEGPGLGSEFTVLLPLDTKPDLTEPPAATLGDPSAIERPMGTGTTQDAARKHR